jgi:phosphoribosyl-AMP cyclohydrolase
MALLLAPPARRTARCRPAFAVSIETAAKESGKAASGGFWLVRVVIVQQEWPARPPRKRLAITMPDGHDIHREQGNEFLPKFDASGLITAVVTDAGSGAVLMVAFMDAEALAATRATGFAHFHSRSRGRLWKKGESSGHVLAVREIMVDCDQDAVVLRVEPAGPACHTGAASCFYRTLDGDSLRRNDT